MEPIPLQKLNKIDFGRRKPSLHEVTIFHVAQMICSAEKWTKLLVNCCFGLSQRLALNKQNHTLSCYYHPALLKLTGRFPSTAVRVGFSSKAGDSILLFCSFFDMRLLEYMKDLLQLCK